MALAIIIIQNFELNIFCKISKFSIGYFIIGALYNIQTEPAWNLQSSCRIGETILFEMGIG